MTARPLAAVHGVGRVAARRFLLAAVVVLSSAAAGRLVAQPTSTRLVLGLVLATLVLGLALADPRHLLYALVLWLAGVALVRRLVSETAPPSTHDVLVLIGPLAFSLLALVAVGRGALHRRSRLANGVLALSFLALVGAANPLQGSFSAGIAGLLFVLAPMLAFWVGRIVDDRVLLAVFKLIAVLAIPAAIYGLVQTLSGFPHWDTNWINQVGTANQLGVAGVVRPFASFSSTTEYVMFLGAGLLVMIVLGLRPVALPLSLAAITLIGAAVFYSGVRGVLVMLALALGLIGAARARLPIVLAFPALAGVLFLLSFTAGRLVPDRGVEAAASSGTTVLATHQLEGLAHPLSQSASTVPLHFREVVNGFQSLTRDPLGVGTGSVTLAASRFGAAPRTSEADPSNVAVALGVPGVIAYLVVLVAGFGRAYGLARRRGDGLSLLALGILGLMLLQWLNGGLYAVAFLPWLVLGWVDRSTAPPSVAQPTAL